MKPKTNIYESIDTEKVAIGCLLKDNSLIDNRLTIEDFYLSSHKIIFETILTMHSKKTPIDPYLLAVELKNLKPLEKEYSFDYLDNLLESVITTANFSYYIKILKGETLLRKLHTKILLTITKCQEKQDIDEIVQGLRKDIEEMAVEITTNDFDRLEEFKQKLVNTAIEIVENQGKPYEFMTGISAIDIRTAGVFRGQVTVIAGESRVGKTALADTLMLKYILDNKSVVFFSLEMSQEDIQKRFLSLMSKVPLFPPNDRYLTKTQLEKLKKVFENMPEMKMTTVSGRKTTLEMDVVISKLKPDVVFIDFLQLMGSEVEGTRDYAIGDLMGKFLSLSIFYNIPVVLLSQVTKDETLRDSGNILTMATNVWWLRDKNKDSEEEIKTIRFTVDKNKNGRTGSFDIGFIGKNMEFVGLEQEHKGVEI